MFLFVLSCFVVIWDSEKRATEFEQSQEGISKWKIIYLKPNMSHAIQVNPVHVVWIGEKYLQLSEQGLLLIQNSVSNLFFSPPPFTLVRYEALPTV